MEYRTKKLVLITMLCGIVLLLASCKGTGSIGEFQSITHLYQSCPGKCGEQLACEGQLVNVWGYLDEHNVFDNPQSDHGIERFWRNIIGGAASCRFHRPPSGIGLSDRAQIHIQSARMLLAELDFVNCIPDEKSQLLFERQPDEAYLTCKRGIEYVIYFPDSGRLQLDLSECSKKFLVKWLNCEKREWIEG